MSCRHERNSWLILGGGVEWCYVCGAFRYMRETGINAVTAKSPWCIPTKDASHDPFDAWQEKKARWEKKHENR